MRVNSPLVGLYGPSLFYMHLGSFEPHVGSTVPQMEGPSGYCSGSLHNPIQVEH